MQRFTKTQKVTMLAMIVALLFNPFTYVVLEDYFKWVFTGLSLIATVWCVVFLLIKVCKPEKVNIPKKTKKKVVKDSDYLDS